MSQIGLVRIHQALENEAKRGIRSLRRVAVGLAGMAACLAVVTSVLAQRETQLLMPPAVWERVALTPARTVAVDEGGDEAVVTAQWVVADLGGADRD